MAMKKQFWVSAALLFAALTEMISGRSIVQAEELKPGLGAVRYVEVKLVKLRAAPQAWAAATKELGYGTAVTVLEERGGWSKIALAAQEEGYVHSSALTTKRVVFQGSAAGQEIAAADANSVVLAGKGFNRDVESGFKQSEKGLSFEAVDALEKQVVRAQDLEQFIKAGCLGGLKKSCS